MSIISTHTVLAVCLGKPEPIGPDGKETGINKLPVTGHVTVHELGLADDSICNTEHHGGINQAVYIYTQNDYTFWRSGLDTDLPYGTFGENLVLTGPSSATFMVGDQLISEELVLEVTSPRIPCATLAVRMGDKMFPRRFMRARRPGLYCKVIQSGNIKAGDSIQFSRTPDATQSILDLLPTSSK